MMLAKATCTPGSLTLPYTNTFGSTLDSPWCAADGSTWVTSSGKLTCTSLSNGTSTYDGTTTATILADAGVEDIDVTLTWGNDPTTFHFSGFYFNYLDANNYHMVRGDSGDCQLWRVSGGSFTNLGGIGPARTGDTFRIIIKAGMVFVFATPSGSALDIRDVIPSAVISGGTMVGFLTYDTANTFDSITYQVPLYYNNIGTLAASANTGLIDAGSQIQASMYSITTDGGAASPQQWSLLLNSFDVAGAYGVWWQKADSTSATDYPQEFWSGGSTGAGYSAGSTGGAGDWYMQITYGTEWKIFVSHDSGATWTATATHNIAHAEGHTAANTYYQYQLTNRTSYGNVKTWAFAP